MNRTKLATYCVAGVAALVAARAWLYSNRPSYEVRITHDTEGRPTSKRTAGGRTIHYAWDPADRLVQNGGIGLKYDPNGNLVSVTDASGDDKFTFDDLDRMTSMTGPSGKSITYSNDPWNRPVSLTPSGGSRLDIERDVLGRYVALFDGKGLTTWDYEPSLVIRRLPNGVRSEFSLNEKGELLRLRHFSPSGGRIVDYRYKRDTNGRIVRIDEETNSGTRVLQFAFDALGRLVSVSDGGRITTWKYDAEGNRISETTSAGDKSYTYGAGALKNAGDARFTFDREGQLTERAGDRPARFGFDQAGRLVSVENGKDRVAYQYDALNLRTAREVNGIKTLYLNDISSGRPLPVAEYAASGELLQQYIVAGSQTLGVRDGSGTTRWYLEDHLGSVRFVVDEAGRVESAADYTPFGAPISRLKTAARFAGGAWDQEAELIYLGARYMDPRTGRFISRDRLPGLLEDPQSFNRYAYAANDPVDLIDPTGLAPERPRPGDDREPTWTRKLEKPMLDVADDQLKYAGGLRGKAWAAASSFGYACIEATIAPVETSFRNLADREWVAQHPGMRYWEGIKLASVVADLVEPLLPITPTSLKVSFAESTPFAQRFKILETGERWMQNRHWYLPGGLDRLYPASQSFRAPVKDLFELKDIWDFTREGLKRSGRDGAELQAETHPVGGVRLNSPGDWPDDLGVLAGATFDPESGSLILAGEKRAALPPIRSEDLAVAIRAVLNGADSSGQVSMTIDPDSSNPRGPTMDVRFFGMTEDTHVGWVMFECDRIVKGLTVGRDNLTQQPLSSPFPGFRNIAELGLRGASHRRPLWSRFWIVPDSVVLRVSPDRRSLVFGETRMRVKTETMRWNRGKLVSAGGLRDEIAETVADSLTAHYDDLVRQYPVFGELKQMAQVVALAEWMKHAGILPDPRWIAANAASDAKTPRTTPSVENNLSDRTADVTYSSSVFGGADLVSRPHYKEDPTVAGTAGGLSLQWRKAGKPCFDAELGGKPVRAVALGTRTARRAGTFQTAIRLPWGFQLRYDSSQRGWSMLIPHLYAQGDGSKRLSVPGSSDSVPARRFLLSDDFGMRNEVFEESFVDPQLKAVGFRSGNPDYTGVFPNPDGSASLLLADGNAWAFDSKGRATAFVGPDSVIEFAWSSDGSLQRASRIDGALSFHYENGHLARIDGGGAGPHQFVWREGNLVSAVTPDHRFDFAYAGGLLDSVAEDGRVARRISYDAEGRWNEQTDAAGGLIARQKSVGHSVIRFGQDNSQTTDTYSTDGTLTSRVQQGPAGRTSVEWNSDHREAVFMDARGTRKDFHFDRLGRVDESRVNGQVFATYRYDDQQRRQVVDYEDFAEISEFNSDGDLARRTVQPKRSWVHQDGRKPARTVELEADGGKSPAPSVKSGEPIKQVKDATGAQANYGYDRSGRLTSVNLAGGTRIDYEYSADGNLARVVEHHR